MVKNADNPPELVSCISERLCSLSRFFLSMSRSLNFLSFSLVLNGLLDLVEPAEVKAKDAGLGGRVTSGIGLEDV